MCEGRPEPGRRELTRRALLGAGVLGLAAACARPTGTSARPSEALIPEVATGGPEEAEPRGAVAPEGQAGRVAEPQRLAVPLICREAWGAAPARPGGREHAITGLMVHHTAVMLDDNRDAPGRWRGHQRYHQSQGWPDIAYHVGVDRAGNLYELRDASIAGDTFTDYEPAGWLLVVAEGNFDEQIATAEHVEGVAQALAWGAGTYSVDPDTLASHRDHASTSCPGDALHAVVRDGSLAQRVRELVASGGVELEPLCGEAGRNEVADIEAGRA